MDFLWNIILHIHLTHLITAIWIDDNSPVTFFIDINLYDIATAYFYFLPTGIKGTHIPQPYFFWQSFCTMIGLHPLISLTFLLRKHRH